ncbi:MAG: transposase [Verrucomicrobiales bacterium]
MQRTLPFSPGTTGGWRSQARHPLRRPAPGGRQLAQPVGLSFQKVAAQNELGPVERRAFVIDDSIKTRRGKKVEGSSSHWDHTEGRTVRGQQVVELGIAGEAGFLPVDRQIFMGDKNAVHKPEDKDFSDKRNAAARDMARAE